MQAFSILCLLGLAACGGSDDDGQMGGNEAAIVVGCVVDEASFSSAIEAVGTAYADEQTVLTAPVTERIERLYFNDGERVSEGAVIAQLSRGEESADLAAIEARARQAQQQLDRLEELSDRGFATRASLEEQIAARDAARADASAIRSRIGDRVIRAPFSGVLGLRTISEGAIVNAGSPIATLSDISRIKLDFTVPEQFLSSIEEGQPIEATAAAYPSELFRGQIDTIDPVVDPLSRSVTVRAVLPNPERRLRPGMLLSVDVVSEERRSLAVPETALIAQGDQQFVFRIDENGIARRTAIETGLRQDGQVEVLGGLQAGDRIVADGTVKVRDDSPVSANFPEETRRSGGGGGVGSGLEASGP
ncbi:MULTISPECIES: efflux RND transporter periplasmic adaptor subunit [Pacificimonas]|uniref:efflux RND transporter periplasmic adaptor subunit n=1 Tax=Pacificimonas TaxID=1960290 RepID=UPI001CC90890|nr:MULTISPECIES: efflux RND transporter periplasmic adaptor subunit [Pacificimonas]